jgi:hypothetical protein
MSPAEVIRQAEEYASEWLDYAENPAELVAAVLANKIVVLNSYVDYLEERLKHDSNSTRIN